MSPLSKVKHSRNQWKHKATQRGDHNRSQRKQIARLTAERDQATTALKAAQARLRQCESQPQALVALPKVDMVFLALQLFFVARIGFRAVSRVLSLLALAPGHQESTVPADRHQLGDTTLDRPHRSGPQTQGRAAEPGAFYEWPHREDRHQYWPGHGEDVGRLSL